MFKIKRSIGKYSSVSQGKVYFGQCFLNPDCMEYQGVISILTEDRLLYVFSKEGKLLKGIKGFQNDYSRCHHFLYTIIKGRKMVIKNFLGDTILMISTKYGWEGISYDGEFLRLKHSKGEVLVSQEGEKI